MSAPEKENLKDSLKVALAFLSYRARSVSEVVSKLKSKGFSSDETAATIDYLLFSGYLDDNAFARALTESRIKNKHWGARRIAADLGAKGIAEDVVRSAVSGISVDDERLVAGAAFDKWLKKTGLKPPLKGKDFEKAYRHLVSRGFFGEAISAVLKKPRE
ncbi:regulatory protein RecX [bacterium]|nr:MAG: regulatory protein RecX [bacterium]